MNSSSSSSQPESHADDAVAPAFEAEKEHQSFCIVGIGASAGGLEAFTQLLGEGQGATFTVSLPLFSLPKEETALSNDSAPLNSTDE